MSRITGRDTTPELTVRSLLHGMGYRFRVHRRDLPGTPDIILPKYRTVVLVHGCFWHRHKGCRFAYTPKSRLDFWQGKFQANVERDRRQCEELVQRGWQVLIAWECQLRNPGELSHRLDVALRRRLHDIESGTLT
jgi:DNA mismatch endonuclease (patch repair protein)